MAKSMDKEVAQFQKDLLESVRQMKTGKAARTTVVALTAAAEARAKVGVSQSEFALLLGCLLYTSPSPRDGLLSRMPSSA